MASLTSQKILNEKLCPIMFKLQILTNAEKRLHFTPFM